jgi:hypothetical protein
MDGISDFLVRRDNCDVCHYELCLAVKIVSSDRLAQMRYRMSVVMVSFPNDIFAFVDAS